MIGYAFTGSFCTHRASINALKELKKTVIDIIPIMSENVYTTDTRRCCCLNYRSVVVEGDS